MTRQSSRRSQSRRSGAKSSKRSQSKRAGAKSSKSSNSKARLISRDKAFEIFSRSGYTDKSSFYFSDSATKKELRHLSRISSKKAIDNLVAKIKDRIEKTNELEKEARSLIKKITKDSKMILKELGKDIYRTGNYTKGSSSKLRQLISENISDLKYLISISNKMHKISEIKFLKLSDEITIGNSINSLGILTKSLDKNEKINVQQFH